MWSYEMSTCWKANCAPQIGECLVYSETWLDRFLTCMHFYPPSPPPPSQSLFRLPVRASFLGVAMTYLSIMCSVLVSTDFFFVLFVLFFNVTKQHCINCISEWIHLILCSCPGALQATRALMIVSIILTVAGLGVACMGMKCTTCGGDDKTRKSRIAMTGGIIILIGGMIALICVFLLDLVSQMF